jgi:predicted HAD superfamily Cof-like phosphohydrolase
MSHYSLVKKFHSVFGHPIRNTEYINCFDEDRKLINFRLELIKEEQREFIEAHNSRNIIEMADALCDLLYVAYGAALCLGINLEDATQHPEEKYIPNLLEVYETQIKANIRNVDLVINNLQYSNNINMFASNLRLLLINVYDFGSFLGFNLDSMFREVHSSNMSKVCSNIEDAIESVRIYKQDARYSNPTYRIQDNYYVVYDADTSKILKNYKWRTPNLAQFFVISN